MIIPSKWANTSIPNGGHLSVPRLGEIPLIWQNLLETFYILLRIFNDIGMIFSAENSHKLITLSSHLVTLYPSVRMSIL